MRHTLAAFVAGMLFALGLAVGGMTQPSKVIGFLDVFGDWDPSLAFVMAGGVLVHAVLYRLVQKRSSPLLDDVFHVPTRRDVSLPLILGSALFGVGWGLGGFCPGPGVVALPAMSTEALVFVLAMVVGMLLHRAVPPAFKRWEVGASMGDDRSPPSAAS